MDLALIARNKNHQTTKDWLELWIISWPAFSGI